jgi:hypothetical protein
MAGAERAACKARRRSGGFGRLGLLRRIAVLAAAMLFVIGPAAAQLQVQGLTVGKPENRGLFNPSLNAPPAQGAPAPVSPDVCAQQADDLKLQGQDRLEFEAECAKQ